MRASIFDPTLVEFVQRSAHFLTHVSSCPNCSSIAKGEGLEYIEDIFKGLNSMTGEEIPMHDYTAAIEFCLYWLNLNGIFINIAENSTKH